MATVTTNLNENEQLSIKRVDPDKNRVIPPYTTIGRGGVSRHKIKGVDAARLFSTLSGASSWFFWTLVQRRDLETNFCDIRKMHLSTTEKGRVSRAYAELTKNHLVVRYKQGIYLINPKVILPEFTAFEAVWDRWVATCNKRGIQPEPTTSPMP